MVNYSEGRTNYLVLLTKLNSEGDTGPKRLLNWLLLGIEPTKSLFSQKVWRN